LCVVGFFSTDYEVEAFDWTATAANAASVGSGSQFDGPPFIFSLGNGDFSDAAREECRKDALRYYNAVSRTTQFLDGTAKSFPDIFIECQEVDKIFDICGLVLEPNAFGEVRPPKCGNFQESRFEGPLLERIELVFNGFAFLQVGAGNVLGPGARTLFFSGLSAITDLDIDFDVASALVFGNGTSVGEICSIADAVTANNESTIPGNCCIDAPLASSDQNWGSKVSSLVFAYVS
jgi:hypothetical protein